MRCKSGGQKADPACDCALRLKFVQICINLQALTKMYLTQTQQALEKRTCNSMSKQERTFTCSQHVASEKELCTAAKQTNMVHSTGPHSRRHLTWEARLLHMHSTHQMSPIDPQGWRMEWLPDQNNVSEKDPANMTAAKKQRNSTELQITISISKDKTCSIASDLKKKISPENTDAKLEAKNGPSEDCYSSLR